LHPSKLKHLGLAGAAAGFCKEFSVEQRVEIDFQSEGIPEELSEDISICLFRVLQEAVQNDTSTSETADGDALQERIGSVSKAH